MMLGKKEREILEYIGNYSNTTEISIRRGIRSKREVYRELNRLIDKKLIYRYRSSKKELYQYKINEDKIQFIVDNLRW